MATERRNPTLLSLIELSLLSIASAKVFFEERFTDGWESRWVKSDWKKDENLAGEWNYTSGKWHGDADDKVTNCAWREDIIDSAFDNPWMDPNTGLLIDLENHLEVNPENRIGMHQLEYNQEAFYDDQSIVGGDEAFEVDGGLTNSQPIGWLPPQIFYESQMMNFLSENSLYQYDLSQQKVMDYAATGVGHEVDRWW